MAAAVDSESGAELVSGREVTAESVRAQTERVLADPVFQSSQRSSKMLRFIVDRTLNGRTDELKERIIGIEVFGRASDYDTANDPTVRVAAKEVRKRLEKYYSTPEHKQELRIDVPIRSYIAEFKPATGAGPDAQPVIATPDPLLLEPTSALLPVAKAQPFRTWYVWAAAAVVLLTFAFWMVSRVWAPASPIDDFWAPIASGSGPVLICIGAPMQENPEPAGSSSPSPPAARQNPTLSSDEVVQVGTNDSNSASALAAFLRRRGKYSDIRPILGTDLPSLNSQPSVLYGRSLNEWAAMLGAGLHFRLYSDSALHLKGIADSTSPGTRNWSLNSSLPDVDFDHDYALITRIKDQTTGRRWIGIAGLTGLGTVAANKILLDPTAMDNIAPSLPRGWVQKNLQIVLEVKLVHGNPGATRVLAAYSW